MSVGDATHFAGADDILVIGVGDATSVVRTGDTIRVTGAGEAVRVGAGEVGLVAAICNATCAVGIGDEALAAHAGGVAEPIDTSIVTCIASTGGVPPIANAWRGV